MINESFPILPHQPPNMSLLDIFYRAWGPVGPVIYFRDLILGNTSSRLDKMENVQGRC